MSSGDPKISPIERPCTALTSRVHSYSRGPEHIVAKVGARFVEDEIAYLAAVALLPRPAICGKMNQIQWLRLRPARNSSTTSAYTRA